MCVYIAIQKNLLVIGRQDEYIKIHKDFRVA